MGLRKDRELPTLWDRLQLVGWLPIIGETEVRTEKKGKSDWEWEKGEGDPHGKVAVYITCS